jgi:hypothetical protein
VVADVRRISSVRTWRRGRLYGLGAGSIGAQTYCSALGDEKKLAALDVLETLPLVEERAAELRETAEFLLERDF